MATARKTTVPRMAARMWWLPLVPVGFLTDRSSRWRWLGMPGVVIFTALTSSVGKLAIRRPRPGSAHRVVPWGRLGAAGFPSTHSACAFAIAGWLRASRHGRWLHAVAVLIGCSRVRCRAHHSTDVAAGAILGYAIAWQLDKAWLRLRTGVMPGSTKPAPGKAVVSGEESQVAHAGRPHRRPRHRGEERGQSRRPGRLPGGRRLHGRSDRRSRLGA